MLNKLRRIEKQSLDMGHRPISIRDSHPSTHFHCWNKSKTNFYLLIHKENEQWIVCGRREAI